MRRRREDKKRKRKQKIMSITIMVIMVLGFTLAAIVMNRPSGQPAAGGGGGGSGTQQSVTYNGYTFTPENNYLVTEVNGEKKRFLYPPSRTLSVQVPEEVTTDLRDSNQMALTFNPNSPNVQFFEVARLQMANNFGKPVNQGVTQNSTDYNLPVFDCSVASPQSPVIFLKQSNVTSIGYDNGCITVEGNESETVRATERLIYSAIGVMDG